MHASQPKSPPQIVIPRQATPAIEKLPAEPLTSPPEVSSSQVSPSAVSSIPVETGAPAPPAQPEQAQIGRVKALWESGKYVQAMELVDRVLADHPESGVARTWKKRIRAAQDAEAAIK
jgi:hypothetical protein